MWFIAYVDTNLVGSGKVSKAVIIGLQGGIWAASPGYNVCATFNFASFKWLTYITLGSSRYRSRRTLSLLLRIQLKPRRRESGFLDRSSSPSKQMNVVSM